MVRKSTDNLSKAILPRLRIPVAEETAVNLCPCMACTVSQLSPQTPCVLPKTRGLGRWELNPGGPGQGLISLPFDYGRLDCTFITMQVAHLKNQTLM